MRLAFTGSPLDHAALKRVDPDWIAAQAARPEARAALFVKADPADDGAGGARIVTACEAAAAPLAEPGLLFLGLDGETPWFCAGLAPEAAVNPLSFRAAAMAGAPDLVSILGRARALLSWHHRHRFCSKCATATQVADGGARRSCPGCGMQHFPRVEPSVIMLPVAGDRCVLGRQAGWPEGFFATLAGFMEPGETIEEACAREIGEEVGLKTRSAMYLASQPWPFPYSLMIGLIAEVEPGELYPDDDVEAAAWFTRDEARRLYDEVMGRWVPPHFSISRALIDSWLSRAA